MLQNIAQFFSRLFHGSKLSVLSFSVYFRYKKLFMFPCMASVLMTLVVMGVFGTFFVFEQWFKAHLFWAVVCIFILLFVVMSLIDALCKTMTVYAVGDYAQHGNTALFSTFTRAMQKIKNIALWALCAALIKMASGKKENNAGASMISFVLGTSWQYLSFFIFPIFALEKRTFVDSLKRSAQLTHEYFGVVSGSIITFSITQWLAILAMLGIVVGFVYLLSFVVTMFITDKTFIAFFVMPVAVWAIFVAVQLVLTAQVIMSTLIYRYKHGQSTGFISSSQLERALQEIK